MSITRPARGMRDFLPGDVRRRQYVIRIVAQVFEGYGFEPLETPAVENIETLLGKSGEESDKLIFKILKRGGWEDTEESDLALRYDLTVPLARVVAEYRSKLPKFFKRYQVQPVWRADRPQKGRFREFYQCDVDAIGSTSMVVEAELLSAAADVFARLRFTDFTIRVNHRRVLNGILLASGVPRERYSDALVSIDKWDKVGKPGVHNDLVTRGFSPDVAKALLQNIYPTAGSGVKELSPDNSAIVTRLTGLLANDHEALSGARELRELLALTERTSTGSRIAIDPALARGLSYYTGPIFEITVPDLAGSLGGGGRYDDLIGMFLGERVPAAGISLGLERILVVMAQREMFPSDLMGASTDVMVLAWSANLPYALEIASSMRAEGVRVEMYPEPSDKMDKKMKYAANRNVPCVAIVGEEEADSRTVVMRDMATRAQAKIPCVDAAAFIKARSA